MKIHVLPHVMIGILSLAATRSAASTDGPTQLVLCDAADPGSEATHNFSVQLFDAAAEGQALLNEPLSGSAVFELLPPMPEGAPPELPTSSFCLKIPLDDQEFDAALAVSRSVWVEVNDQTASVRKRLRYDKSLRVATP